MTRPMNQITVGDLVPRGELLTIEEQRQCTANKIDQLERELRIDSDFAKQLREEWL